MYNEWSNYSSIIFSIIIFLEEGFWLLQWARIQNQENVHTHTNAGSNKLRGILMDISSFVLLYISEYIMRTFTMFLNLSSKPNHMFWDSIVQISLTMLELQRVCIVPYLHKC